MKLLAVALLLACSCSSVLGTDDLFICETCPSGGAGGGGSGAGGDGGDGGDGACGAGEHEVTFEVQAGVTVKIDEDVAQSGKQCLLAGKYDLSASCSSDGDATEVSWGNGLCDDEEDTCQLTLSKDEKFVVSASEPCDG